MKCVFLGPVLIGGQSLAAVDVLSTLVKAPAPGQGFNLGEMRSRIRVLDALDAARDETYVDLEDADHAVLAAALNGSSFTLADRGLLELIDRVIDAKAPVPPPPPVPEPNFA